MFYSDAILSKRGPLGRVWLAAHMERKLSKTQTLQTDIGQSVNAIIGQEVEIMALRLSGQLLLGVVRIYNRKAKYLLDDCNEAMLKLKMAFRAGPVDMTNAQLAVDRNAITLQGDALDLDVLLPDINWDIDFDANFDIPTGAGGHHVARPADITLPTADDTPWDLSDVGYGADLGPSDGIASNDFDLGISFETDDAQMDDSMEVGRDAPSARHSIASHLVARGDATMDLDLDALSNRSREPSMHPFDADIFGPDAEGMDIDLGIGFEPMPMPEEREKTPDQTRSPTSPLTEPPLTPPADFNLPEVPTVEGDGDPETPVAKAKRPRKEKKQIVDSVTELAEGPGAKLTSRAPARDLSAILAPERYLPRSAVVMRLLAIRDDPIAHFLPTTTSKDGSAAFFAGPPGLAPELRDLFMRPIRAPLPGKKRGGSPDKERASKKARLGKVHGDEDELEQARRDGSVAPSVVLGSDVLGRHSVGPDGGISFGNSGMGMDDFQLELPDAADVGLPGLDGGRDRSIAPSERSRSRHSTPGLGYEDGEGTYADATCPIVSFDMRQSQAGSSQPGPSQPEVPEAHDSKGYSKNTVKAMALIRQELQPSEDDGEEKVMSFKHMSEKASRRAASSFFFEMLVLATRDCIGVTQPKAFENIEVRATSKLWENHSQASVAPSISSTM